MRLIFTDTPQSKVNQGMGTSESGVDQPTKKPPLTGLKSGVKIGLTATSKFKLFYYLNLICLDDMSKQEMIQIIESQKKEIQHLQEKVKHLDTQKEQIVDNFKLSSSVLLERLKDLEQYKQQAEQMAHLI